MRRVAVYLLVISLALFSCKSKHDMLVGNWHAVKLENPEMDSFFINSQNYIDTIGRKNDESTNVRLYGVTNMDSLRKVLQTQYDTARAMQQNAVTNTVFRFRKDSLAVLIFNGMVDSAKWHMDKDDKLVLEDLHDQNAAEKINMEILKLTDVVLKLRFKEDSNFSVVTFRRVGK